MTDAPLESDVPVVETGAQLGCSAKIGARGEDAEAATEPRHAGGVGPVRRLAGLPDDAEHIRRLERMDRQPVEPLPARPAVALAAPPARQLRAGRTLRRAHSHGADHEAAETRMGLEVAAQLALDGRSLEIRRTPARRTRRETAPLFNAFEQRLSRCDRRQNERYGVGDGALDVLDRAGPFHLVQGRVDDEELVRGNGPRQEDRHGLAVLAAAVADGHERAPVDGLAASE